VVDQRNVFGGLSGLSTGRRQRQALGNPRTFEHVIPVGESVAFLGVTVDVLRRDGHRLDVRVTGSYHTPDASFFAEAVGANSAASCAVLPIDAALAEGCTR